MDVNLSKSFWENRYKNQSTGWDIGYVSTPIKEYIDQLSNKKIQILIPGAGNSYEAEYLHKRGFTNVTVIDIAKPPLENLKNRVPDFPEENLILGDFFELKSNYELIIEQTFFCALPPNVRNQYVEKMYALLKPEGKLVGLLFNAPLNIDKPPFGGSTEEYIRLFSPKFEIKIMESATNSIAERAGNEVFINFIKK